MSFIRSIRLLRYTPVFSSKLFHASVFKTNNVLLQRSQTRSIVCTHGKLFSQQINEPLEENDDEYIEEKITVLGKDIAPAVREFEDIKWPKEINEVIKRNGYTQPTSIQGSCWPVVMSGRDLVGVAKTGCGKTLAYLMPAIYRIIEDKNIKRKECSPLALILAPTRELTQQIYSVAQQFRDIIKSTAVFGGASKIPQANFIEKYNPELIIATPGRLIDFMMTDVINPNHVMYLVLDEADRMLDMGFEPQIRKIVHEIPKERQTLMFSATWPKDVRELAQDFLNDFIQINVGSTGLHANPNITQNIEILESSEKRYRVVSLLKEIIANEEKVLIFTETKFGADTLSRILRSNKFSAVALHGDKSQQQRDNTMRDFRRGNFNILVATDVASRGIDVSDIKYVINYDFPRDIEDYVHRIGRTARGYSKGTAYSFFCKENAARAVDLIKILRKVNQNVPPELEELAKYSGPDYSKKQRFRRSVYDRDDFNFNFKKRSFRSTFR